MSILDDLSSAIRTVHDSAGPAVVGIGQRVRGSGVVIADGRVLTNAHNLRGDEVTVTFRDGRPTRGTVRGVDPTAISPSSRSTRPAPRRSPGPTPRRRSATSSSASASTGAGAARVTARHRLGDRADVPGPGREPDRRQPRAHRAAGPGLVGRPARRRRAGGSWLSTPTGSARASTSPVRPTPRCASGSTPSSRASPSAGRGSGSRSPRRASPSDCAGRSG